MFDCQKILDELKRTRKLKKITIDELSLKTGISRSTLLRYENNKTQKIPIESIQIIANALDADISKLINYKLHNTYYLNEDAAVIAEELKNRHDLRVLLDASSKISKEDLQFIIKLVEKMDKDNN